MCFMKRTLKKSRKTWKNNVKVGITQMNTFRNYCCVKRLELRLLAIRLFIYFLFFFVCLFVFVFIYKIVNFCTIM